MRHEGERIVQRRAGFPDRPWGSAKVGAALPRVAADFLRRQRMVVIGAPDARGAVWAGPLAGGPGFATAPDDRTVVMRRAPVPGDPLARLFTEEHPIGVLAIEPASRRRMRVNGLARQEGDRLVVRTEQVYANCPKYIQARDAEAVVEPAAPRVAEESSALSKSQREWIAGADTFFVATHAAGLGADVSHRGGRPGFVAVADGRRLSWPDYAGNSMYMTLGNLELDPHAGLLFLDWERGATLQVTGRASVDWDPARAAAEPGAQRMVDFEVEHVVRIDGAVPLRWGPPEYSKFNPDPYPGRHRQQEVPA
ncbi:pyridoxamine 5'-phosphate oxidase family protein [Streptomonospora sp. S1-112]|uniref:Pyridoxamine 5'-phosphate oxidase family protein n=1 Tax=Streptomonospora mangrovi TaxID=2883123 RepID=A0A9X3NKP6_9ACTN|nr:pyridoxamine 5'-phosphate oxidase family protein [Streptomonospora mangrovi]MDA0565534.1 pyridoxamine 5'-phosphate oxidase family protein [Streptomonospora mangrovi]